MKIKFVIIYSICISLILSGCAANKIIDTSLPKIDARKEIRGSLKETKREIPQALNSNAESQIQLKIERMLLQRNKNVKDEDKENESNGEINKKNEQRLISINMLDGRIDQLLLELAKNMSLNLIIEPQVLNDAPRVSLSIKNTNITEVIAKIIEMYDIYPVVSGSTLIVKAYEEKIFNLDILNSRSTIKVDAGGDALGGSNSNKGSVSLGMEGGDKTDPFEQLIKAIEIIISNTSDSKTEKDSNKIALNKTSGTLFVKAKPSRIKIVSDFINNTKTMLSKQVQIDVQLVDVQLLDEYNLGIDWGILSNNIAAVAGSTTAVIAQKGANFPSGTVGNYGSGIGGRVITLSQQTVGNVGAVGGGGLMINTGRGGVVFNALKQFGTVKLVSNPSLRMKNGVPAYISVGTNFRIVSKVTTTSSPSALSALTQTDVQTDSIFSGVVLAVTALIKEDNSIELFVHPSQSRAREDRLSLIQVSENASVTLPIIEQKSISTTLNLKDDDMVILGGLIDQQNSSSNAGIPKLSDLSIFGGLFGRSQNNKSGRELIIIVRAKLI